MQTRGGELGKLAVRLSSLRTLSPRLPDTCESLCRETVHVEHGLLTSTGCHLSPPGRLADKPNRGKLVDFDPSCYSPTKVSNFKISG